MQKKYEILSPHYVVVERRLTSFLTKKIKMHFQYHIWSQYNNHRKEYEILPPIWYWEEI